MAECIGAGFSFPNGPPQPGADLTLSFTGAAFENVGFAVDGFITQNVDVEGVGPVVYTATLPGGNVPASSATIQFLSDVRDPTPDGVEVASCVANY